MLSASLLFSSTIGHLSINPQIKPIIDFSTPPHKQLDIVKNHITRLATPIQLQVTTDIMLRPGYGTWGNILLPAPTRISQGQMVEWTWPWKKKAPHMRRVALLAPRVLQHEFCVCHDQYDCRLSTHLCDGRECVSMFGLHRTPCGGRPGASLAHSASNWD